MRNGNLVMCGFILCFFLFASGTAFAASYDSVTVSSAFASSVTYQNFGVQSAGPGTGYITNLTEPAQEFIITSQIPNAFSYAGQTSSSVTYLLTPYELNEVAHAPNSGEQLTLTLTQPWSSTLPVSFVTAAYPLLVTVTGYATNASTVQQSTTLAFTGLGSQTTGLKFYNITAIRLSRALPLIMITANDTDGTELAWFTSMWYYIVYPQAGKSYLGATVNPSITYNQQNGQPASTFSFTAYYMSSSPTYSFYNYAMPEYNVQGSTSSQDSFVINVVNSTAGIGATPLFQLNYSRAPLLAPNKVTYIATNGTSTNVGVGFTSQKGSVVAAITPTSLTFNLALTAPSPTTTSITTTIPPITISTSPSSVNVSVGQMFSITNNTSGSVKPYTFSYSYTCQGSSPCTQQYLAGVRNGNSFTFTQAGSYIINLCASGSGSPTATCANTKVQVQISGGSGGGGGGGSVGSIVTVTASDPQDYYYVRDWQVFVNEYPGPYLGNGQYMNSSTYSQVFGSSGTMTFMSPPGGSGVEYLDIGQSGGSAYGTYSGTVSFNGVQQTFGGLDVNHVLKLIFSGYSLVSVSVVTLPSPTTTTIIPTTTIYSTIYSCDTYQTVYVGQNLTCGQFTVRLAALGSPNQAGQSSADLLVYNNGVFTNSSSVGEYNSTTFNMNGGIRLYANVGTTFAGLYSSQKWAQIQIGIVTQTSTLYISPSVTSFSMFPGASYRFTVTTNLNELGSGSYQLSASGINETVLGLGQSGGYYNWAINVSTSKSTPPGTYIIPLNVGSLQTGVKYSNVTLTVLPTTSQNANVRVQATDFNDQYLRDWNLFYIFPGAYLGNGNFQNRSAYTSYGYSGYNFNYNNLPAAGTFYIVIGQSGGSAYGTYQGTIWIGTQSAVFSGLDVNHALKVTYDTSSVPNIKSMSVVPLPVLSNMSTTSTITTVATTSISICTGGYYNATTQTCQIRHSCPVGYTLTSGGACIPSTNVMESYTVNLQPGWNLISPALNTFNHSPGFNSTATTCSGLQMWGYNNGNGNYSKAYWSNQYFGTGYWAYTTSACSLTYYGASVPSLAMTLSKGWNLIGIPLNVSPTSFNSVTGSCNVIAGPYWYNSTSHNYYLSTEVLPGRGYFINVADNCNLYGNSLTTPPPLP